MRPAPFYLIVDDPAPLERFLPLGLATVQLRVKDRPEAELRAAVRRARELCAAHGCRLVVNDHWRVALEEGCDTVHLGQEDLDTADLGALRAGGVAYGISTHDRAELRRALALDPAYVALGPIHATLMKAMKWRPQGLGKLRRWKDAVGALPLVAIGGFTPERAAAAFAHGADSVCVVTDVLRAEDPPARVAEWLRVTAAAADAARAADGESPGAAQ